MRLEFAPLGEPVEIVDLDVGTAGEEAGSWPGYRCLVKPAPG